MKTYRIKEITSCGNTQYEVQRKSIFGFWYNPDNIDAYTTGMYNNFEDAKQSIIHKLNGTKCKIIFNSNERETVRKHEQNKEFCSPIIHSDCYDCDLYKKYVKDNNLPY